MTNPAHRNPRQLARGEHPLIAYLQARLAEREAAASAASDGPWTPWRGAPGLGLPHLQHGVALPGQGPGSLVAIATASWLDAEHIALHDPTYVLADIDSKRRILVRCEEEMLSGIPRLVHFAQQTLRELAMPYAGRGDYPKDQP